MERDGRLAGASCDVAVIGGGPAGATAARLLREWGHAVTLFTLDPGRRTALAESIPPSAGRLLEATGALEAVSKAGFLPTTGNTSWWESDVQRVEIFSGTGRARGWQVLRGELEALLLRAAATAGVEVRIGARVRRVDLAGDEGARLEIEMPGQRPRPFSCRQVLDASGRAGVLARRGLRVGGGPRTLGFSAVFRSEAGFPVPDDSHTLVEAFADGWGFSVPLAGGMRHFTLLIDPPPRGERPSRLDALYRRELAKARHLSGLLESTQPIGQPWVVDASTYSASTFAGDRFALVGDAGSFLDPLSSYGVKKALASAWLAAVAAHTALRDPSRARLAAKFFSRREAQVSARYAAEASRHAALAAGRFPDSAFWSTRSRVQSRGEIDDDAPLATVDAVQQALARLKSRDRLRLRLGDGVRLEPAPMIVGREIVLGEAVIDRAGRPLHFVEGVKAPLLVHLALASDRVEDVLQAWSRAAAGGDGALVVRGLAVLLANGCLADRSSH